MAKLRDIYREIKKYLLIRDIKTGELNTISINGSNVLSFEDLSNLIEKFKTSEELKQYLLETGIIKSSNVDLFISDYDSQYYKNKKFKLKPLNGKINKDDYIFNIDHPDCLAQPVNDHERIAEYEKAMDRIAARMVAYNYDNGIIEGPASKEEYIKKIILKK